MHNAPSVNYPVGRSGFAGAFLLLVWLLGAAAMALWVGQTNVPGWRQGSGLLALGIVGFWAGWTWWRTAVGELSWDTQAWTWSAGAGAGAGVGGTVTGTGGGSVTVNLDLQDFLLLRWRGGESVRNCVQWFWLERSCCPARWDELRRAVYSRAIPEALPAAMPPAAKP